MKEYSTNTGEPLPEMDPSACPPGSTPLPVQFATASAHEIIDIDLDLVIESRTNPRTVFDPDYIKELGATIKQQGRVLQPILLRPLPASRVEETAHMRPRPTHEIVFGACRYRGSRVVDMPTIRATVENLTDAKVLLIQLLENLKRKGLNEFEEADGYRRLMEESGLSADEVGKAVDKSRSYVFGRIKLLNLCSDARAIMREYKVEASVALVVARIPDQKLQIKAMKDVATGGGDYHNREPMTFRQAADHVQQNYMIKLSSAKFDIKKIDLVPAAGGCKDCAKRTGYDPDLYSEVKSADVCTDPPCFHKKEEAHAAHLVKQAKDKGQTVIAGKEAQELMTNGYHAKFKGYKRLDVADDSPTDQPLRKLIGKQMQAEGITEVKIEHPQKKGELVAVLPNEVVLRLLKAVEGQAAAAKTVTKEVQAFADDKKAKAEAKAKDQYEKEWRADLVHDTWATMRDDADIHAFDTNVHRYLVKRAANSLSTDNAAAICKILNLGKVSPVSAVIDFAKETPAPDLLHLLIVMQEASGSYEHSYGGHIANEGMMLVAGNVFGAKLQGVIKEIQDEACARIMPKIATKAPTATAPAARPKEGAGGSKGKGSAPKKPSARAAKLSAEEATQGIADALQGIEGAASADAVAPPAKPGGEPVTSINPKSAWPFPLADKIELPTKAEAAAIRADIGLGIPVGQRVKVLTGKYKGKEGAIIQDIGDDCYRVKVDRVSVPTGLRTAQMEVLEGAAA